MDSQNVTSQMADFERRLSLKLCTLLKTFYMSQMNPKKLSIILHSQFKYQTLPVTPFNLVPQHLKIFVVVIDGQ